MWQSEVPGACRTEAPVSLLVVSRGGSQLLEGSLQVSASKRLSGVLALISLYLRTGPRYQVPHKLPALGPSSVISSLSEHTQESFSFLKNSWDQIGPTQKIQNNPLTQGL